MSCGNEGELAPDGGQSGGQTLMPPRRDIRKVDRATCQKCKAAPSKYIMHSATFCPPCFESTLGFRFRRTTFTALRTPDSKVRDMSRPPVQNGDAVIAVSGGAGSVAMLELIMRADLVGRGTGELADLTRGEKQAIWDWATVVHVRFDEGDEVGIELRRVAEGWGLRWLQLKAEDVFDPELGRRLGRTEQNGPEVAVNLQHPDLALVQLASPSSSTPREKLHALLSSLAPASRPAMLQAILDHLLVFTANALPGISHLLLGETATRQAQRIISGTALGRGWALPLDLAGRRTVGDVVRLKPMRDISVKDAAVLCRLRGLATWNERRWPIVDVDAFQGRERGERAKGGTRSIEGLTERFIAGLGVSHPSTVSTINRTGDKLVFAGEAASPSMCPLCESPLEPSALDWKCRSALTSLTASNAFPTLDYHRPRRQGLASMLCYACLTTVAPATVGGRLVAPTHAGQGTPVVLPRWVAAHVAPASITEFLIGDEE